MSPGFITQASALIIDNDPYDPYLIDDFEHGPYLWRPTTQLTLETPEIAAGDPMALPGQDALSRSWTCTPCRRPDRRKSVQPGQWRDACRAADHRLLRRHYC